MQAQRRKWFVHCCQTSDYSKIALLLKAVTARFLIHMILDRSKTVMTYEIYKILICYDVFIKGHFASWAVVQHFLFYSSLRTPHLISWHIGFCFTQLLFDSIKPLRKIVRNISNYFNAQKSLTKSN